jgi:outer membrane protein TolC
MNALFPLQHFGLIVLLCLSLAGCALPQVSDPGPPPVHWLEQAAAKVEKPVPVDELMDQPLDFDRCLLLAMRQSPMLHNSAIEMEIAQLQTDSAFWNQLPEFKARFSVTTNITRNDEGNDDDDYGDTSLRAGFGVSSYNPVAARFSYEARLLMEKLALLTHCKAVENLAARIGETLVRLETLDRLQAVQEELPGLTEQALRYYSAVEPGQEKKSLEYARTRQQTRVARAAVERTAAERRMILSGLKLLLGIPPEDQLRIGGPGRVMDHQPADDKRAWEMAWNSSTDNRMLETGLKLQDYNILLAWSRFLPETHLDIFSANAKSSFYGSSGDDDIFASVGLAFPILDWGDRSRGVRVARLQKTQFADRQRQNRKDFASGWAHARQEYESLLAELELREENLELARLETRKARIEFETAVGDMRQVLEREEREAGERIRLIELQGLLRQWQIKAAIRSGYLSQTLLRLP